MVININMQLARGPHREIMIDIKISVLVKCFFYSRTNYLQIDVYFPELTIETITQVADYLLIDFFGKCSKLSFY